MIPYSWSVGAMVPQATPQGRPGALGPTNPVPGSFGVGPMVQTAQEQNVVAAIKRRERQERKQADLLNTILQMQQAGNNQVAQPNTKPKRLFDGLWNMGEQAQV